MFCYLVEPLHILLKSNAKFHWGHKEVDAFSNIKKALIFDSVLGTYYESTPKEIHTDASDYCFGTILMLMQSKAKNVLDYASEKLKMCKLTLTKKKCSTTERGQLAVLWAIKKFRPLLDSPYSYLENILLL